MSPSVGLSVSQFLADQDELARANLHGLLPEDVEAAADALRALAVVAMVRLDGARRLAVQALGVERARDVARAVDGTMEVRRDLVLADDEVEALVLRQRRCHAVAAAVDVDELARLRDAVERRDVDIREVGLRLRLVARHLLAPVPVDRVLLFELLVEAHLLERHRAAEADCLALDGRGQIGSRLFLRIEYLERDAAPFEIRFKSANIHTCPPVVHTCDYFLYTSV